MQSNLVLANLADRIEHQGGVNIEDIAALVEELGGNPQLVMEMNKAGPPYGTSNGGGSAIVMYIIGLLARGEVAE